MAIITLNNNSLLDVTELPSGISGQNYPAFEAILTANQGSVSNNAYTKVNLDSEIYDTDGCYDNTTNYRFTPTVAGKYFAYTSMAANRTSGGNGYLLKLQAAIKKNGSFVRILGNELNTSIITNAQVYHAYIFEMNGSTDYLELFGRLQGTSGTVGQFQSTTFFGAYRIGD